MFLLLLAALLVAATVHSLLAAPRSRQRSGELFLLYLLVGYCGLPMLAVSLGVLVTPERIAEMFPVGPPTPLLSFFGWAYLGMSLLAILALRYRGSYLVGAVLCWSVYWAGATMVHLHAPDHPTSHAGALVVFAVHGLVAVLLVAALAAYRLGTGSPGQDT